MLNHNIYVVTNQSLPITQKNVIFLRQGPEKGTAKAVEPYLVVQDKSEYVLILAGDTPLISKDRYITRFYKFIYLFR